MLSQSSTCLFFLGTIFNFLFIYRDFASFGTELIAKVLRVIVETRSIFQNVGTIIATFGDDSKIVYTELH